MELNNDELMLWTERSSMIVGGEVVSGEMVLTNRRMVFIENQKKKTLSVLRKGNEIWDLDIWGVQDVTLMEMVGYDHPLVRIHYKESEVFFTFPELEPRPAHASLVIFINQARMIEKTVGLVNSLSTSLKRGEIDVGERPPKLIIDEPQRADETCHQCAKMLLDEDADKLSSEINECLVCETDQ